MAAPQPARPPRRKRPPSGAARQQAARQAALITGLIILAAELAILAALAAAILAVLAGILLMAVASRRLRAAIWQAIAAAEPELRAEIAKAQAAARADVAQVIEADLGYLSRLLPPVPSPSVPRLHTDLRNALLTALGDADAQFWRITRHVMALPEAQREAAAQALLDDLALTGLTGLTDVTGRDWNLTTYARTATAGAIARMHTALQLAAYEAAGIDLVLVTRSDPRPPCPRCAPFVGRVLSISGRMSGLVTIADANGTIHSAQVVTTVAEARKAGLLHISCRDSLTPWADGAHIPRDIPHGGPYTPGLPLRARELTTARREHALAITRDGKRRAARRIRFLR